ncbi:MAG: hypothetical protein HQK51_10375 [Oligoflexia bacterium]|nr:hypothetical protein [Oligoflexia bacterium]
MKEIIINVNYYFLFLVFFLFFSPLSSHAGFDYKSCIKEFALSLSECDNQCKEIERDEILCEVLKISYLDFEKRPASTVPASTVKREVASNYEYEYNESRDECQRSPEVLRSSLVGSVQAVVRRLPEQRPIVRPVEAEDNSFLGGLENIAGTTCFLNSTIQLLSQDDVFINCVKKNSNSKNEGPKKIAYSMFSSILKNIREGVTTNVNTMIAFRKELKKFSEWQIPDNVQMDVDDAYNNFADIFSECFNSMKVPVNEVISFNDNGVKVIRRKYDVIDTDKRVKSVTIEKRSDRRYATYTKGNEIVRGTNNIDKLLRLPRTQMENSFLVSIAESGKKTPSIKSLLSKSISSKKLSGENQYNYNGKKIDAEKSLQFSTAPDRFVVKVNRADLYGRKNLRKVTINETFPASILDPKNKKSTYHLESFTCHIGAGSAGGHWINIKQIPKSRRWVQMSDGHRSESFGSLKEVLTNYPDCSTGSTHFSYNIR